MICLATVRRREAGSASCVTTLRRPQVRAHTHTHTLKHKPIHVIVMRLQVGFIQTEKYVRICVSLVELNKKITH